MIDKRNIALLICFVALTYVTINLVIKTQFSDSELNQNSSNINQDGWKHLFNGHNLSGWQQVTGNAIYTVEQGTIVGKSVEDSPNSFLATTQSYADFELQLEVKLDEKLNSGIQIRSYVNNPTSPGMRAGMPVSGPQIEIYTAGAQESYSGFIYGEGLNIGGWLTPKEKHIKHKYYKNGEWNHYKIIAKEATIQTWLNGQKVSDLTHVQAYEMSPNGFIALQVHSIPKKLKGQGPFKVQWKNIKIKEI